MQPMGYLRQWLEKNASDESYLFMISDLKALFPSLAPGSFRTLLSRSVLSGCLDRVCRGLYRYPKVAPTGLILFHAAARLRANHCNYISLETVLSDAGVISQMPINYISVMSSGRGGRVSCGRFGTIEFIHTKKNPSDLVNKLYYDARCRMWRANIGLALSDMKSTHRNCDLIDWDVANELI